MVLQLIPERPSRAVPAGELRLAMSWRRDGGKGIPGQIKKFRGMNLDLVVTAYRSEGDVVGMFAPLGLGGTASDWVWIAHDEKRGGRLLWDESALVDLSLAPPVVSKLSVAVVAHQSGTSFDQVPKATLDVYGPDGAGLLVQSEAPLTPIGSDMEHINVAVLMNLERHEGGWKAVYDTRWGYAKPGDLSDLRNTMGCLA